LTVLTRTEKLLVFDSLNSLSGTQRSHLPALLSSFIGASSALLALYHVDVPLPVSSSSSSSSSSSPSSRHGGPQQQQQQQQHNDDDDAYAPSALTLLRYLATTIFTTHSLHHVLAQKAARGRSHAEPVFGLEEGVEGVLQSLGANGTDGTVLEMEHRRKSGRGVREWYFLPRVASKAAAAVGKTR
jgi:elongator complex protein 5